MNDSVKAALNRLGWLTFWDRNLTTPATLLVPAINELIHELSPARNGTNTAFLGPVRIQRIRRVLSLKMNDELSQRDVVKHPEFSGLGEWGVRKLMGQIRDAAAKFARLQGDEGFQQAIERLMAGTGRRSTSEWAGWSSPWSYILAA